MSDQLPCKQCGHYAVFCDDQRDALSAQVRELEKKNFALHNGIHEWEEEVKELQQSLSTARESALEEAAKIVEDHYWDSMGEIGKAHGNSIAKMIRALKPTGGETK